MEYPTSFLNLIEAFRKLPGVGAKSAERMAFDVLSMDEEKINNFKEAIDSIKNIKKCPVCGAYLRNEEKICYGCERKKREELENIIRKRISKEPWIKWYDLQKIIQCSESEFNMVKNDVEMYYFEKIRLKTANAEEEKLGVQLKAGKPLALIKEKEFDNILKFLQKGK